MANILSRQQKGEGQNVVRAEGTFVLTERLPDLNLVSLVKAREDKIRLEEHFHSGSLIFLHLLHHFEDLRVQLITLLQPTHFLDDGFSIVFL